MRRSGGATVAQVATPAQPRWPQWLLIAALALGIVAMHHLPDVPAPTGQAAAMMAMQPAATHLVPGVTGPPVIEAASGEGYAGMDMMGHMCLAVRDSAYIAPTPAPTPASPCTRPLSPPDPTSASAALDARAPPPTSSVRRSQLGVWRR